MVLALIFKYFLHQRMKHTIELFEIGQGFTMFSSEQNFVKAL